LNRARTKNKSHWMCRV